MTAGDEGITDMLNRAALIASFTNDVRYQQAVIDGRHGDLQALVNADNLGASRVWQPVEMRLAKQILGPYLSALTADQRDVFRTLAGDNETLDLRLPSVQETLIGMFPPKAMTDLATGTQRAARYADDFAAESVPISEIHEACRQVPSSALAKYLDPTTPENVARQAKSADINRVGAKIQQLRQAMLAKGVTAFEFDSFRFAGTMILGTAYADASLYEQPGYPPGGVFAQPEDQREAFIDAKMVAEGLVP